MDYRGYNDYYLLYLINEQSDEAINIMFEKYEKLIYKKIHSFKFNKYNFEDVVQEGKMVLLKAINKYSTFQSKTFMRFFEMLLDHKFIDLKKREKRLENIIYDNEYIELFEKNYSNVFENLLVAEEESLLECVLSSFEMTVYRLKFIENKKVREISSYLNVDEKQVSNAIQRIKKKIKK